MMTSYFVLEVLLLITEIFIHVKTSGNWFFSVVKGFRAKFDDKIQLQKPSFLSFSDDRLL